LMTLCQAGGDAEARSSDPAERIVGTRTKHAIMSNAGKACRLGDVTETSMVTDSDLRQRDGRYDP
jgi:hypothetical protein